MRENPPLQPEERQLGNVETNGFVEVVVDGDVTIYGAGHVGGSVSGGTRPTLDKSRIRQKRKDEPASGAARRVSTGAGGEQPSIRDFLRCMSSALAMA
jgi:hypothetical protein